MRVCEREVREEEKVSYEIEPFREFLLLVCRLDFVAIGNFIACVVLCRWYSQHADQQGAVSSYITHCGQCS